MKKSCELNVKWSDYKSKIIDRLEAIEKRQEEIRKDANWYNNEWSENEYRSLSNEAHELREKRDRLHPRLIPEVGMPCTVLYYSDRSAGYIKEVKSPKHVVVQEDGLYHGIVEFTFRSNGRWVQRGTTSKDWGTMLGLGYRSDYYDQSF